MVATRLVFKYKVNYKKLAYFYFGAKNLLVKSFFNNIINVNNLTQIYLTRFLGNKSRSIGFGLNIKKYKRPINISTRQVTSLRRIRDNLRVFYFNKPKKS